MFARQTFTDTSKRRRLSRWALNNAWKLSGLTALISFIGVFAAVAMNIFLRPMPKHFFPLLSDVSKHEPETTILYSSIAASIILFLATTMASILHWHSLHLYVTTNQNNNLNCNSSHPQQQQHSQDHQHHNQHQQEQQHLHLPENQLHQLHHSNHTNHANASIEIPDDEIDVSEIVPASPPPSRRRNAPRLASTRAFFLLVSILIITFSTVQFPDMYEPIFRQFTPDNLKHLVINFIFYSVLITLVIAKGFLIWYFLKLQTLPDYSSTANFSSSMVSINNATSSITSNSDIFPLIPSTPTTVNMPSMHSPSPSPSTPYSPRQQNHSLPVTINDESTSQSPSSPQQGHQSIDNRSHQQESSGRYWGLYDKARSFASWVIAILRPTCLTGQAVCFIKIFGLWLALDTFSISSIHLVQIALLATLAFVEYTSAFFFSFFMTILAIDMRSKAPPPDIIFQS